MKKIVKKLEDFKHNTLSDNEMLHCKGGLRAITNVVGVEDIIDALEEKKGPKNIRRKVSKG